MKTKTLFIIMFIALLLCFAVFTYQAVFEAQLYAKSTIVIELDYNNDLVTVKDSQGFLWTFTGCEDWDLHDICSCVMNNKGTNSIFDDEIISVRFENWT